LFGPWSGSDARALARKVERIVVRGDKRKYKKFRVARFYGGCATADCVGCFLRCRFCWVRSSNRFPEKYGKFYSPEEVVAKLKKLNASLYRISSGEPTIGRTHLIRVLELLDGPFLLETNGVLLDRDYCSLLSSFRNLHVRLSFKGVDEKTFRSTTGASGFKYQVEAAINLTDYKISFHPAIISLYPEDQRRRLAKFLIDLGVKPTLQFYKKSSKVDGFFEVEKFVWYPFLKERGFSSPDTTFYTQGQKT